LRRLLQSVVYSVFYGTFCLLASVLLLIFYSVKILTRFDGTQLSILVHGVEVANKSRDQIAACFRRRRQTFTVYDVVP